MAGIRQETEKIKALRTGSTNKYHTVGTVGQQSKNSNYAERYHQAGGDRWAQQLIAGLLGAHSSTLR